jgi:DDE superfamily endonuclease
MKQVFADTLYWVARSVTATGGMHDTVQQLAPESLVCLDEAGKPSGDDPSRRPVAAGGADPGHEACQVGPPGHQAGSLGIRWAWSRQDRGRLHRWRGLAGLAARGVAAVVPSHLLLMDNLKAHTVAGGAETRAAAGVRLLSLPPYSPDLSPLEECWSKVKALLRAKAARTLEALAHTIAEALDAVTAAAAQGWFAHTGHCMGSN